MQVVQPSVLCAGWVGLATCRPGVDDYVHARALQVLVIFSACRAARIASRGIPEKNEKNEENSSLLIHSSFIFISFSPKDSYLGDLRLFLQVRAAFMFRSPDFFAGGVGLAECWPGGRGYVPDARVQVSIIWGARARGRALV